MAVGTALGVTVGVAVGAALPEGDALVPAVALGVAVAVPVEALGEALGVTGGMDLVSSTTPQTVQVLCSVPDCFSVAASTTVQSVAICPIAGIDSV